MRAQFNLECSIDQNDEQLSKSFRRDTCIYVITLEMVVFLPVKSVKITKNTSIHKCYVNTELARMYIPWGYSSIPVLYQNVVGNSVYRMVEAIHVGNFGMKRRPR